MTKTQCRKQIEAEANRIKELTAKIAAMTTAELAIDMLAIKSEMEVLDHERRVSPNDLAVAKFHSFQWGRLSERRNLNRVELAARRAAVAVATVVLDDLEESTDAELEDAERAYRAIEIEAWNERDQQRAEMAQADARDALVTADSITEPF